MHVSYCISQNLIKNQQENQGQVPKLKYPQKQKWPGNEYYIEMADNMNIHVSESESDIS